MLRQPWPRRRIQRIRRCVPMRALCAPTCIAETARCASGCLKWRRQRARSRRLTMPVSITSGPASALLRPISGRRAAIGCEPPRWWANSPLSTPGLIIGRHCRHPCRCQVRKGTITMPVGAGWREHSQRTAKWAEYSTHWRVPRRSFAPSAMTSRSWRSSASPFRSRCSRTGLITLPSGGG
jgi:hypothetical protein